MQPFGRNRYGPKIGGCAPLGEGELGPHLTQCCQGRPAYLHAKFHLDLSNRLATVHERYRQDRQTDRTDNGPIAYGEPFYKRSPKNCQRQTCSAINCLSSGINILAGRSSVPLISERKGADHIGSTCVAHTSPHSAAAMTSLRH